MGTFASAKMVEPNMTRLGILAVFIAFALITWRDLSKPVEAQRTKDIPTPSLSKFAGPTLSFLYCYS